MADSQAQMMDRMFQRIMRGLVDTGRPPHYAELARALGMSVEDGRELLHAVMSGELLFDTPSTAAPKSNRTSTSAL